jgi:G:T-mismatch repair DNA endonuclease (very short patch repair protein)
MGRSKRFNKGLFTSKAEDNGYRYLVIWESQIKENDWSILDEI